MDFNKKQRTILTVGILVIILMGLFPPWVKIFGGEGIRKITVGYAFIAAPSDHRAVLDISRLCVQWIVVLLATGLGVFLSGKSNRNN